MLTGMTSITDLNTVVVSGNASTGLTQEEGEAIGYIQFHNNSGNEKDDEQ